MTVIVLGLAVSLSAGDDGRRGTVTASGAGTTAGTTAGTARILLAGDVMLGRGVAAWTTGDPDAPLAGVRDVIRDADLAAANLESPLTTRPHLPGSGPNTLEAGPSSATALARAGFDVVGVANNHAGDAGPATVTDTVTALTSARLVAVGGGTEADAFTPRVVAVRGLRIAWLAVDATGAGPRPGPGRAGVAWWDADRLRSAVTRARRRADLVVVGLHGGAEYHEDPGSGQTARASALAGWGADVVWGHHPHVVQPVTSVDVDGDGRRTVVAPSLGNLLFDQHDPAARRGLVLELLAGRDGVRAMRQGEVRIGDGRTSFTRWLAPGQGHDAGPGTVLLHGTWWNVLAPVRPDPVARPDGATRAALVSALSPGASLLDVTTGDVDRDGETEVIALFRRPHRPTPVSRVLPRSWLVDSGGRSLHVGIYRSRGLGQIWVAGSVLDPVSTVASCGEWLVVGLDGRPARTDGLASAGVGAWRWNSFGFVTYPDVAGPRRPGCSDVDGDGSPDPLAAERNVS